MSPDKEWHLIDGDGKQCGPYTEEQLQSYAKGGIIIPTTQLWTEGLEDWIPASDVPGLFRNEPRNRVAEVARFIKSRKLGLLELAAIIMVIYGLVQEKYLYLVIAIAPFALWMTASKRRCPHCKRWRALRRTGRVDRGRWYHDTKTVELKCRHCGHTQTEEVNKWWGGEA